MSNAFINGHSLIGDLHSQTAVLDHTADLLTCIEPIQNFLMTILSITFFKSEHKLSQYRKNLIIIARTMAKQLSQYQLHTCNSVSTVSTRNDVIDIGSCIDRVVVADFLLYWPSFPILAKSATEMIWIFFAIYIVCLC